MIDISIRQAPREVGHIMNVPYGIDDAGFDILREAKDDSAEVNVVSHFAVSPDGQQLIQTNTRVVSENGVVVRTTIKWFFVFRRPQ